MSSLKMIEINAKKQQSKLLAFASLATLAFILQIFSGQHQLATCSMCQHHQALLMQQQQQQLDLASVSPAAKSQPANNDSPNNNQVPATGTASNLIVCPKSSQFNDMPQFPSKFLSPTLERQQRHIMQHLNASFANHIRRSDAAGAADISSAAPLIDDELLNEILSPLVVDAAFERAKELIVKRRKFENELVRQGEFLFLIIS